MSERLTVEEIEQCRTEVATADREGWPKTEVTRVMEYMLHLHDTIQRLRNLQINDVTPEELEAVNDGWYPEFMGSGRIAAVCRGMLREVKSE